MMTSLLHPRPLFYIIGRYSFRSAGKTANSLSFFLSLFVCVCVSLFFFLSIFRNGHPHGGASGPNGRGRYGTAPIQGCGAPLCYFQISPPPARLIFFNGGHVPAAGTRRGSRECLIFSPSQHVWATEFPCNGHVNGRGKSGLRQAHAPLTR